MPSFLSRLKPQTLMGQLRFRVGLLIIILSVLNLLLLGFIEKQNAEQNAHDSLEQTTEFQSLFIDRWFKERGSEVETLANLPAVKRLNIEQTAEAFHAFQKLQDEFYAIIFINSKGITEIDTDGGTGIDVSDREYFRQAKNGKPSVSDILIGRDTGKPVIIFASPVFDQKQAFQGAVIGTVNLNTFNRLMKSGDFNYSGETYLIDGNGKMITESKYFPGLQPELRVETLMVQEAKQGRTVKGAYENYRGIEVFGHSKWVNGGKWLLVGEVEKQQVLSSFYRTLGSMAVVFLSILLFGRWIMLRFSKKILTTLDHLIKGALTLRQENYTVRISPPSDPIELVSLCETFNDMAQTIQDKTTQLSQLIETTPNGIVVMDAEGKIILTNAMTEELFGLDRDKITKRVYNDPLWNIFTLDGRPFPSDQLPYHQVLKTKKPVRNIELVMEKPDGEEVILSNNSAPLLDAEGNISGVLVAITDITESMKVTRNLERISTIDGLTGIFNRRHFDEIMRQEWQRCARHSVPLSLVMFDIDFFKLYNDTYGHQAGDDCLKSIAFTVSHAVKRGGEKAFRYGGEEFAIILPDVDQAGAAILAEKIRSEIEKLSIPHKGSAIHTVVTTSMGIASIIPNPLSAPEIIISKADKALYQAKRDGRNRVITAMT